MVAWSDMSSEAISGRRRNSEEQEFRLRPEIVPVHSKPDLRLLGLLALGHMVVDINNGAIPALLPFLKSALALSYTSAAVVVLMSNITSSLIQPVFGYFADKTARRWLLPVSIFVSAVGIAFTGLSNIYGVVL